MADAEAIVIGGGHNGLICAAYLARAGVDTVLLEARSSVGGCASTVSDLGARFNICNCDHTLIRAMPILDELDLEAHGLRYVEPEASYLHLFHDDTEPWLFFADSDRTLDGLAHTHPNEVANYRRYLADALPVARAMIEMARSRATATSLVRTAVASRARGLRTMMAWSRLSATAVLDSYFNDWHLTMPAISTGPTVWGVPPDTPGTGLAAAAYATRHLVRTGRPVGGSGALTDALRSSFEAAGGRVRCEAAVSQLLIERSSVSGVQLDGSDGERLTAPLVIASCDPRRVLGDWLSAASPEEHRSTRRITRQWSSGEAPGGYESKIDAVITRRPVWRRIERLVDVFPDVDLLEPTSVISPSPSELSEAHALRAAGAVSPNPTFLVNVPSVLDPSMVTPDKNDILSIEALFTPYDLAGGWPTSPEPARWIDVVGDRTESGFVDSIDRWRAMTPDRYESEFHLHRGHAPAYAATPLATLAGRRRELSRYRTPVQGLYLTGAATWPGAGIFGAPGRNAADGVLRDIGRAPPAPSPRWARRMNGA